MNRKVPLGVFIFSVCGALVMIIILISHNSSRGGSRLESARQVELSKQQAIKSNALKIKVVATPTPKPIAKTTPTPLPTSTPTPKSTPTPVLKKYTTLSGIERGEYSDAYGELVVTTINLWENPGTDRGKVVGKSAHNEKVEILEQKQDDLMFYKVKTPDNQVGWVSERFITSIIEE